MKYSFTDAHVEGFVQRNPEFWAVSTPPKDATEVIVDGGYPDIAVYFEDLGVEVEITESEAASENQAPSREDIAEMKKADLINWLEAHGIENPTGKVGELRKQLASIMFFEG